MKTMQKGFTLIELMIVVAIIGILAALAIPQYQNFIVSSQVSEGPKLVNGVKPGLSTFTQQRGQFPASNGAANKIPPAQSITGKYVSYVSLNEAGNPGQITIRYKNQGGGAGQSEDISDEIDNNTLTLSAFTTGPGSVEFACNFNGANPINAQYAPSICD